jgi:hypothetical protein
MAGFVATPEWERFRGSVQGSSVDWATASEGVMYMISRALASNNLTGLNILPNCRDSNKEIAKYNLLTGNPDSYIFDSIKLWSFVS